MRDCTIILFALGLACSLGACDSLVGGPQLLLTADSSTPTVSKGCGPPTSASICKSFNYGATYLHLERNGYVGTVTLSSDGPYAELTPSTLPDTQTVTRLVIRDYTEDKLDKTIAFSVRAAASGAQDAVVSLVANVVWPPSWSIAYGKPIGSVVQGQKAMGTVVVTRTKYPGPVTLSAQAYATSSPSAVPSQPALSGLVQFSPNPTTGDVVDLIFDATSLAPGYYAVEVRGPSPLWTLRYIATVTPIQ